MPRLLILLALAACAAALLFGWLAAGAVEEVARTRGAAALRAGGIDWARLEADGARLILSGEAPDAQAAQAARRALAPLDWTRLVDRTRRAPAAPAPAAAARHAPPEMILLRDGDSLAVTGRAPEGAGARIAARRAARGESAPALLALEQGRGPDGWRAAEEAALDLLAELAQGRAAVSPGALRLSGLPRDAAARRRIETRLAALRAEGVQVEAAFASAEAGAETDAETDADTPSASDPRAAPDPEAPLTARLALRWRDGTLLLSGLAPDAPTRDALRAMALAEYGVLPQERLFLTGAPAREGWRARALAAIAALAALDSGEASVTEGAAALTGTALRPEQAIRSAARFREGVGAGGAADWALSHRVTIDLPARLAAALLPPARCAERLTEIARADPILFEPGAAEITEASAPALDALAAALTRCAGGVIEVGGHTDSQGSEGYNLGLSERRAASVRRALEDRGAPPELLRSRGYGEAQPIADNDSESGRALNRRIAFIALQEEEDAAP